MASHSTSARCKITKYWVHQNLQLKCKHANLNVNRPNVLQLLMVVIENFKKKDARSHGILGYSTKRIERLTFCFHLILRRAFRYYIRNSYSLPQRKYLSAVNVLSAHVGKWNSCRNTYMIMVIDLRVHGVQKGRNYTSYVKMNECAARARFDNYKYYQTKIARHEIQLPFYYTHLKPPN